MPTHEYQIIYKGEIVERNYTATNHDYARVRADKKYGRGNYETKVIRLA